MNTTLPKSDAKNAYDLLLDVIKVVQEEPKRLNMSVVIGKESRRQTQGLDKLAFPPCGTMGCVAGWTILLRNSKNYIDDIRIAEKLLMPSDCEFTMSIYDEESPHGHPHGQMYNDLASLFFSGCPDEELGTPEYVEHVVNRIRAFMSKYETQLKAKTL